MSSPALAAPTRESLAALVVEIVRDQLLSVGPEFGARSNLVDAGLDSLALTQLLLAIEERTGIWVDESLLTPENLESAEALAACIDALGAGRDADGSAAS
ncbi:MAG TPA: acyl carrier protein [Myxococcota bacterium]|jgi:acyl carrier protein|nr:acyl carrier protein [Myxococcota bacterium]